MASPNRSASLSKDIGESASLRSYEPPYRHAGIAGFAIFLLYVITLAPTTAFWDTSEYIATANIVARYE